ncbi:hypothetical protein N656DRAFT_778917 [Canariomyces notabilis]|uniref:Uncharacterized protein n=1 Tax=Canariomyces notabilis TaxID=2074819 RepID=A0AAN6YSA5_9PEZI|nr:hypothetical protein N656DRAFT_778917 [Canariomyces arenarius]
MFKLTERSIFSAFTLALAMAPRLASASVVILPGGNPLPLQASGATNGSTSFDSLLRNSAELEFPNSTVHLLLSSYSGTLEPLGAETANPAELVPSGDSFVRGAIQAWGEHLHFEIRPDEVWFTILTQLNFYMQSHAEELRHLFVTHSGQEEIYIEDYTWTDVLWRFKDEIQARIQTPWLRDWIVPDFSTTTADDVMTANILMMGLMKAYFRYEGGIVCGLPSVTLLGEKQDWENLLARLDRLAEFGAEPDQYRARLVPILSRFVRSFDEPDSEATRKFWNQIVFANHRDICGSSPLEVSGWITGFMFWDNEGKPWKGVGSVVTLDGVGYGVYDIRRFPAGYARAPFIMRDFGGMDKFPAYVAAGTLGKRIVKGAPKGYAEALARAGKDTSLAANASSHGTVRPLSAWMLYGPLNHNVTTRPPRSDYDYELFLIAGRAQKNLEARCGRNE